MKKKIVIIIFLLVVTVILMSYFEIGFFAKKETTKYTLEDVNNYRGLVRTVYTPNPYISNPDNSFQNLNTDNIPDYAVLLPLVEITSNQEGIRYERCLNCEYNTNNPEYCEDLSCSSTGVETNRMNFFFCDNPYINGWDPSSLNLTEPPSTIPSNLGSGNENFYNIWKCLEKFRKDLIINNSTCAEMLDKTRQQNQNVINEFKNNLPLSIRTQLENAINNPTDTTNGIPITDNTVEDYILYNKYIQFMNSGFRGFRSTYKDELLELEEQYSNPEIDAIYATCDAIHTAPNPTDVVCQLDELIEPEECEFDDPNICRELLNFQPRLRIGEVTPYPPPPIPSVRYGSLGSNCDSSKINDSIELCEDAFEELSGERIEPIIFSNSQFQQGCGLLNGEHLIYNDVIGSPSPSIAPLCRR